MIKISLSLAKTSIVETIHANCYFYRTTGWLQATSLLYFFEVTSQHVSSKFNCHKFIIQLASGDVQLSLSWSVFTVNAQGAPSTNLMPSHLPEQNYSSSIWCCLSALLWTRILQLAARHSERLVLLPEIRKEPPGLSLKCYLNPIFFQSIFDLEVGVLYVQECQFSIETNFSQWIREVHHLLLKFSKKLSDVSVSVCQGHITLDHLSSTSMRLTSIQSWSQCLKEWQWPWLVSVSWLIVLVVAFLSLTTIGFDTWPCGS